MLKTNKPPKSLRWLLALSLSLLTMGLMAPSFATTKVAKAAVNQQSPMKLLKTTQKKLQALLNQKIDKKNKAALEAREAKMKNLLEPYFDFGLLAQRTLGAQWAKIKKTEQKSFTFWLRALLEHAHTQGIQSNKQRNQAKPTITYKKEKIKGDKATVFTKVKYLHVYKKRNRKRWKRVRVDWKFEKLGGTWKITDIVTNDNSLIDTYKEQFEKIIKKKVNELRKKRGLDPLADPK